jgi:hypothetical protein
VSPCADEIVVPVFGGDSGSEVPELGTGGGLRGRSRVVVEVGVGVDSLLAPVVRNRNGAAVQLLL